MIAVRHIPHDMNISQLPRLCDEESMKVHFEQQMRRERHPGDDRLIRSLQIRHIRYKPGRYAMVLYDIDFHNSSDRTAYPRTWYVRTFKKGKSAAEFQEAQERHWQEGGPHSLILHMADLECIAWGFPSDRKIASLPQLIDVHYLRHHVLPVLLEPHRLESWDITMLHTEVIHYVPEHTCTMRVTTSLQHPKTLTSTSFTVFGKIFANPHSQLSFYNWQQLWNSPDRTSGTLVIPEPLHFDQETNTVWQSSLHGTPLSHYPLSDPRMCGWLEKAGTALARLHHTPIHSLPSNPVLDIQTRLHEAIETLVFLRPSAQDSLNDVSSSLADQTACWSSGPMVTLHGDPHRKNLFLENQTVGLIDLDSLSSGPPLCDVGSCLASIWYRVALGEISTALARVLSVKFLHGYQRTVSIEFNEAEVCWSIALFLVIEQAARCATTFKANRLDIIDHLVHMAKSLLEERTLLGDPLEQKQPCLLVPPHSF
ncbi:MAG: phosphotransferase [Nitrospira sp.]|nr:phosphotransferase [Nitrospira sp.]